MSRRVASILLKLEPFGLLTLAGGLLYSIGTLTFQVHNCQFHFLVLTLVIFVALVSIVSFKYFQFRYSFARMARHMEEMKRKQ